MLEKGQTIELAIDGFTINGDGVGRFDEQVVFVALALPGEKVKVQVTDIKPRYARAEIVELLEPSPYRREPFCPLAVECGGCSLQHIDYNEQLQLKQGIVADALRRIGGIDIEVNPVIAADQPFNYRNRAQLHCHFGNLYQGVGFFRNRSNQVIDAENCLLLMPSINDATMLLRSILPDYADKLRDLKHIALHCDTKGDKLMIIFVAERHLPEIEQIGAKLINTDKRIVSVWENFGLPVYGIFGIKWRHICGTERLEDKYGDNAIVFSPGSFTQVNPQQMVKMYKYILDIADLQGNETVLDIYSGTGSIGLMLARTAARVICIENFAPAVQDAQTNARRNNIGNCRFLTGEAERLLPELVEQRIAADLIVLDPPRSGCEADVVEAAAATKATKIIYVSCDPATLARDLRLFSAHGYQTKIVQPFDMFPQTGHVECVVLMSRVEK